MPTDPLLNNFLDDFLDAMIRYNASDLYLSTGAIPAIKINGVMKQLSEEPLKSIQLKTIAYSLLNESQRLEFEQNCEMNIALSKAKKGRFRVNIFRQRSEIGMVIRRIQTVIPDPQSLGLPAAIQDLIMEERGLILFVGTTGSGKSTSVASLIHYRNEHRSGHIISIEDPIEFLHSHKKSIVTQREIGIDTKNYKTALKNALRQAPDMILIGEIRTQHTMEQSLLFAETGTLCISTLHATNASQALERIVTFFPEPQRKQILVDLSFNLKAIIAQRLIPSLTNGRVAAIEILLGTPLILSLIERGEFSAIRGAMEKTTHQAMQTFDQSIEKLFFNGLISKESALRYAESKTNMKLNIQLKEGRSGDPDDSDFIIKQNN